MLFWLGIDVLGAGMLFCAGLLSVGAWRGRAGRGSPYWFIAGVGLFYLAVDERLSLHERIGRWLYDSGVPTPPGVNHMDDAVLVLFAAAGALVTLAFGREIARHRGVVPALLLGGAFTAGALTIDARAPVDGLAPRIEELLELAGQLSLLAAMWLRWAGERAPRRQAAVIEEPSPALAPAGAE